MAQKTNAKMSLIVERWNYSRLREKWFPIIGLADGTAHHRAENFFQSLFLFSFRRRSTMYLSMNISQKIAPRWRRRVFPIRIGRKIPSFHWTLLTSAATLIDSYSTHFSSSHHRTFFAQQFVLPHNITTPFFHPWLTSQASIIEPYPANHIMCSHSSTISLFRTESNPGTFFAQQRHKSSIFHFEIHREVTLYIFFFSSLFLLLLLLPFLHLPLPLGHLQNCFSPVHFFIGFSPPLHTSFHLITQAMAAVAAAVWRYSWPLIYAERQNILTHSLTYTNTISRLFVVGRSSRSSLYRVCRLSVHDSAA